MAEDSQRSDQGPAKAAAAPAASGLSIYQANTQADITAVVDMFRAYTEWLGEDLTFQNYDAELAGLPGKYSPSSGGALLLARDPTTGSALGCIALRPLTLAPEFRAGHRLSEDASQVARLCEVKRLYTYPSARGRGVARALVQAALAAAKEQGYDQVLLDSLIRMAPAIALYKSEGFVEVDAYYSNPLEAVYMAKDLRQESQD